ncbi:MAG: OmpA family protein [Rhodobacteraceae bacterium]|nr:OmpA family protein [Paracoccaceae bacterium]
MAIIRTPLAIVVVAGLGLSACVAPDGNRNNTGTGALAGAGIGATIGAIATGGDGSGAVIGGIIGGVLGTVIGDNLDKQEAALRRDLGGSGVSIVNTGSQLIVTLPEAITFPVDSSQLRSGFVRSLNALARNLQSYPNTTVEVIGHTDSTGSRSYNQQLSNNRAASVRSVLISAGVQANRVRAYGKGETTPIASNNTAEGRQQNRRVEIYITPTR